MNILVTGGAGFIGTNLIKKLLIKGHKVLSIDNYHTGTKNNHQSEATYIESDITTFDYSQLPDIDMVFHLAALARIQVSFDSPVECINVNSFGTLVLVNYASDNNIPLVYAGTSSKHGGKFKNPYTFSKDIGEDIVTLFQKHYGLQASIARFYNVYGPHQLCDGPYCTVIGTWLKALQEGKPLLITGTGEQRRDFTHVSDIIDALYLIYEKNAYGCEFELGRGKSNSLNELIQIIKPPIHSYISARPGETQITVNTDTTAQEVLGWRPNIDIEDYLKTFS